MGILDKFGLSTPGLDLGSMKGFGNYPSSTDIYNAGGQPPAAPAPTGPAPAPKPLAGWAPTLNKVPGLKTFGDFVGDKGVQDMLFMGGAAARSKYPMKTLGQSLADVRTAQMLQGQPAPTPAPAQAPKPAPAPAPATGAIVAPGAPNTLEAPVGSTPNQPSAVKSITGLTSAQPTRNFSNEASPVSGGAAIPQNVSAPTLSPQAQPTLPAVMSPADTMRRTILDSFRPSDDTGPRHDPWGAGAITALRPGFNPTTGDSAGLGATKAVEIARQAELKRRDDIQKNLIDYHKNMYAPEVAGADIVGKRAKAEKDISTSYETDLKAGLGSAGQRGKYIGGIRQQEAAKSGGKAIGEIEGKNASVEAWIEANPQVANTPVSGRAFTALGIKTRADLARSFNTVDPSVITSIESAAARVDAANIAGSRYKEGEQLKADVLRRQINNDRATRAQQTIKEINSRFFDTDIVKPGSVDHYAALQAKKVAMTPKVKAALDDAMNDYKSATDALKGAAEDINTKVAPSKAGADRRGRGKAPSAGKEAAAPSAPATPPPASNAKGSDSKTLKDGHYKAAPVTHKLQIGDDTYTIPAGREFVIKDGKFAGLVKKGD